MNGMDPEDYGYLSVRVDEEQPLTLDDRIMNPRRKIFVVERADPIVSASAELMSGATEGGFVHDGVLRVGTDGYGLGVVEYRISEHPAGPEYRVLTRVGTDRDR